MYIHQLKIAVQTKLIPVVSIKSANTNQWYYSNLEYLLEEIASNIALTGQCLFPLVVYITGEEYEAIYSPVNLVLFMTLKRAYPGTEVQAIVCDTLDEADTAMQQIEGLCGLPEEVYDYF
jgi:hypothetical protein